MKLSFEQTTKKWIVSSVCYSLMDGFSVRFKCPACGKESVERASGAEVFINKIAPDFCKNCGADMRGSDNDG